MKNNFFKSLLTIVCLLCSISTSAYDFEVDDIYYNVVSLSDLTCSVTSGANKYVGRIVIPETVNYANRTLTVISIDNYAFSNCSGLTSVMIGNSVNTIEEYAFRNCSGLTSVTIGNSVTMIGNFAFYGCSRLTNMTIPNPVITIGNAAFENCDGLTSVTIGNSVNTIGDHAFDGCSQLLHIKIEDGKTTLSLGYGNAYKGLFHDCPITTLYLGRNLSYTSYASDDGFSPFADKKSIKELTIGNSVTTIGRYAFYGCSGLTSLTIPNSVKTIESSVFRKCSQLSYLKIEDGETTLNFNDEYTFRNNECPITTLYLGRDYTYKSAQPLFRNMETLENLIIGNSVKTIGNYAFWQCGGLTSVTIGNSVTTIGNFAFEDCSELMSVEIGNSVKTIGSYAFKDCSRLTSVTIPNSVTMIANNAFEDCSGLTNVTIGNSVTMIYDRAFFGCSRLMSLTLPNSVTMLGNYALSGCSGLTELYSLNTTPPSIGSNSFTNSQFINLNVYVPYEALEAYQSAYTWKDFWQLQGFGETGIMDVKSLNTDEKNIYYDLSGKLSGTPKHGLNIINGKKVMMK